MAGGEDASSDCMETLMRQHDLALWGQIPVSQL